jgi:hypothetical protein
MRHEMELENRRLQERNKMRNDNLAKIKASYH